jgi:TPR repeat protein
MNKRGRNYQASIRAYRAKDYDTARHLLIRFAEEGDAEAQTMIGSMYQLGLEGLEINEEEALRWYLPVSRKGEWRSFQQLRHDGPSARRSYRSCSVLSESEKTRVSACSLADVRAEAFLNHDDWHPAPGSLA